MTEGGECLARWIVLGFGIGRCVYEADAERAGEVGAAIEEFGFFEHAQRDAEGDVVDLECLGEGFSVDNANVAAVELAFDGAVDGAQRLDGQYALVSVAGEDAAVGGGVHQQAARGFAVTPGAARFLVVGFERVGWRKVDDEAHVGLVDAHAKGDGGDDDAGAPGHKVVLYCGAVGDAGVIVGGGDAVLAQQGGDALAAFARPGVDDAAAVLGFAEGEEVGELFVGVAGVEDFEAQVGAGAVAGDDVHVAELLEDVAPHARWGGRGDGEERRVAKCFAHALDDEIVGTEVVAPHADAVGFVDDEAVDVGFAHWVQEGRLAQPFRRGVDQVVVACGDALHLRRSSSSVRLLLMAVACWRTGAGRESTWSFIRAMRGEMTRVVPSSSSRAGSW